MSSPEERLREKAKQLEAQRERRERDEQEAESRQRADLQIRANQASTEASAWLARTKELVEATGKRIPFKLEYDISEGSGFELTVGRALIRPILEASGWRVVRASPSDLVVQPAVQLDLPGMREQVVERMVELGLEDLMNGRVEPGPDWGR